MWVWQRNAPKRTDHSGRLSNKKKGSAPPRGDREKAINPRTEVGRADRPDPD
jgi:hypothetical protein